jgi:hypothetical protein
MTKHHNSFTLTHFARRAAEVPADVVESDDRLGMFIQRNVRTDDLLESSVAYEHDPLPSIPDFQDTSPPPHSR